MEVMVDQSNIFAGVYKDKRVLVTGHTGFKGSWLSLWLIELGARVAGFSKYLPSDPCHFDVIGLKEKVTHFEGDICDIHQVRKIFQEFQPQIVFHLAAQPIVRNSYNAPKLTFDTNLGGTVNILECLREIPGIEAAVIITSDKCYENIGRDVGYREGDRLGGEDPYSASKACAELACHAYFHSFFQKEGVLKVATTRAGNVIGGGDWAADRIVPDCVRAWSEGNNVIIRKPEATRPWQHVLEPLSGYLWLGACLLERSQGLAGEAFNFGPDEQVVKPVGELVDLLARSWGKGKREHVPDQEKKEATLLKLSCAKALEKLQWRPLLTFEETIELTAQWYKKYYDEKNNLYDYGRFQVKEYVAKGIQQQAPWAVEKNK